MCLNMKLLLFFVFVSTSVLSYDKIDSVAIFEEDDSTKIFIQISGVRLDSEYTRIEDSFFASDTLTQIDLYIKHCDGPVANVMHDTILALDNLVYPDLFNLKVNMYYDTNTVYTTPPMICPIYNVPDLQDQHEISISEQTASVYDHNINTDLIIYPNPASDEVSFQINKNIQISHFEIADNLGRSLSKGAFKEIINVQNLPKGQYFIYLHHLNGVLSRRFVKQ